MTIAARHEDGTKTRTVRLSMDVPKSLHKRIRMHALDMDQTMTDYVIALVERDLQGEEPEGRTEGENTKI